jgi:hypothetical protein
MIIWGGRGADPLNTGGRYNPAADTWMTTRSMGRTPEARYDHGAVWTDTEMIVWGGLTEDIITSSAIVNTGGRYDPATDRWTPTLADVTTPEARFSPSAIWTGTEMIIWGGLTKRSSNLYAYLNTGGRYDPAVDTWVPTPVIGAHKPYPRNSHSAVWTGYAMMVWGGSPGPLDTGEAYCRCDEGIPLLYYLDADGDGLGNSSMTLDSPCSPPAGYVAASGDCNDADADNWATPGDVRGLTFTDESNINWEPPFDPGASSVLFDVLRSASPDDFTAGIVCISSDQAGTAAIDTELPPIGAVHYYLIRAENACPDGQGSVGHDSSGVPRVAAGCL